MIRLLVITGLVFTTAGFAQDDEDAPKRKSNAIRLLEATKGGDAAIELRLEEGDEEAARKAAKKAKKDAKANGAQDGKGLDSLLKKIEGGDLPEAYDPKNHQDYVDGRLEEMTDEQRSRMGKLWKRKLEADPEMEQRGASFVKILEYAAQVNGKAGAKKTAAAAEAAEKPTLRVTPPQDEKEPAVDDDELRQRVANWARMREERRRAAGGGGASSWRTRSAVANSPMKIDIEGFLVEPMPDGDENLVKAETLKPRQTVEFLVSCRNTSEWPIENINCVLPIPKPSSYVTKTASMHPLAELTMSIDGGKTFGEEPIRYDKEIEGEGIVQALAKGSMYTHVSWNIPRMEPDQTIRLSYRTRVNEQDARDLALGVQRPFPLLESPAWAAQVDWTDTVPSKVEVKPGGWLAVDFKADRIVRQRSKVMAICSMPFTISRDEVMIIDVNSNLKTTAKLALAFWEDGYVESKAVDVQPGKNPNLTFDFGQPTFKSEDTNWGYSKRLPRQFRVNRWLFILYPNEKSGDYDISNLRLVKP
jgi:hypothetical protein